MARKACLPHIFFSFFLIPLAALLVLVPPAQATSTAPLASPGGNSTEFIRSRCGATRYPVLCYTSLARYSSAVRQSPVQLAGVAANLTLARVSSLSAHVAALGRACSRAASNATAAAASCPEAAALRDCADALCDAADLALRTAGELWGLAEAGAGCSAEETRWRVANAQTWMSAALTNEETCTDGFEEVDPASPAKADVSRRSRRVKQFTSNALALVNGLVAN